MSMSYQSSYIEKVEEYVSGLLLELPENLCYHNLKHTKEVVEACKVIGTETNLSTSDLEIIIIAAWFHDTGHIKTYFGHEKVSIEIARNFLNQLRYPNKKLLEVLGCIKATETPQKPKNELQKIVCDADMYHLTFDDYDNRSFNLKKEIEYITSKEIPASDWCQQNIVFLEKHCFFTKFGKQFLTQIKEGNIKQYLMNYCSNKH
jgi:HD superfamily phosphodiesterase